MLPSKSIDYHKRLGYSEIDLLTAIAASKDYPISEPKVTRRLMRRIYQSGEQWKKAEASYEAND